MISLFSVYMTHDVDQPLLEILHSGYIGQGKVVDDFEKIYGEMIGNKNVLSLNNGTAALHLAMRLAGVEPNTEVITTAMTCTATNMPILANGGKIVWADIDENTGLIDPVDVERKITSKTKAIVGVDWGGTPCDWDALMKIGKKYGIKVIEDCAHGIGSVYKGRMAGNLADYTIHSLQAIKHITSVDGGILVCKDSEDYKRGKLLRWYGIDRDTERKDFRCEEDIKEWGYKFHMSDVTATIAIHQLKHLPEVLAKYKENAHYYNENLISYYKKAGDVAYNCDSSYWLYTILLPTLSDRLEFMAYMKDKGIMVSQVHARNDTHTCFADSRCVLPSVTKFVERQVSIPVHYSLTKQEREYIVDVCNEFAIRQMKLKSNI